MSDAATLDDYGVMTDATTLTIQRVLPGPIDRVWDYLTKSELRRQWLASGEMETRAGAEVELVWRNNELTETPGARPEGMPDEHRMVSRILECDAPRRLVITWGEASEVSFDLEETGGKVLLTLSHKRAPNRGVLLNVSAGWHAHLDVLDAKLSGRKPGPHWDRWVALKADYAERLP